MQLHFSRTQPGHLQISKMRIAPRELFLQHKLWKLCLRGQADGGRGAFIGSVCVLCLAITSVYKYICKLHLHLQADRGRGTFIGKTVCFSSPPNISLSSPINLDPVWFSFNVLQKFTFRLVFTFICTLNTFVIYIWVGLVCWTEKHFITGRKSKLRLMRPNCYTGRN